MRSRTITFLLLVALIPHAQASSGASGVDVSFSEPALFWHNPHVVSDAPLSVATVASDMTLRIKVEEGTTFQMIKDNHLYHNESVLPTGLYVGPYQTQKQYEDYTIRRGGIMELRSVEGRDTGVLLHAESDNFTQADRIRPLAWGDNGRFSWHAPHGHEFSSAYRDNSTMDRDGVLLYSGGPQPLTTSSDKVTQISWTNTVVTCYGVDPCPESDNVEPYRVGDRLTVQPYVTIQMDAPKHVALHTDSALTTFLSEEWSISGPMAARLPKADGEDCASIGCDGEKTIRLDGDFGLRSLKKSDDDRLSAEIHGDVQNLILDEQPVDPSLLWAIGASTVAAGAIIFTVVSKLGLLGLFTRISADEALEHPRRRVIYEYITESPGATFRELVRNTGIPAGTTRHHLTILRRCDLVVEKPHRSTLRFFENHGRFDMSWDTVVMLREEPLKELHDWLWEHPETPQKDIVAVMTERGHSRGTTQHRLSRLVDSRLVTYRQQGRLKLYTAHERPQSQPPCPDEEWTGLDASWPPQPSS